MIRSEWSIVQSTDAPTKYKYSHRVVVPVNTRAVVFVPANVSDVSEGGVLAAFARGVEMVVGVGGEQGGSAFEIGSGTYTFTAAL
jgi:hypothetical protein